MSNIIIAGQVKWEFKIVANFSAANVAMEVEQLLNDRWETHTPPFVFGDQLCVPMRRATKT